MTVPKLKFRIIHNGMPNYWGFLTDEGPAKGGRSDLHFASAPTISGHSQKEIWHKSKQFVNVQDKLGVDVFLDDFFTVDSAPEVRFQVVFGRYFKTTETPEYIGVSVKQKGEPDEEGNIHTDMRIMILSPEVTKEMIVIGCLELNPELQDPLLNEYMI